MTFSPIVLFVYNRPFHTRQTLDALAQNEEAKESVLHVYCDGAKKDSDNNLLTSINEVRAIVDAESRFKKVKVIKRLGNYGLAENIKKGVSEVIDKYGDVIVLEDDIVVNEHFLKYMNIALDYFRNEKKVFHINGFNNTSDLQFLLKDYYFLKFMSCWGWATWKDRWSKMQQNHSYYLDKLNSENDLLSQFNYDNVLNFHEQLEDNIDGRINTWAILWFCAVFFNEGLCITPKYSFVKNIGLDGSGVHCDNIAVSNQKATAPKNINFQNYFEKLSLSESFISRLHLKLYYKYGKRISINRVVNKIKRSLHR